MFKIIRDFNLSLFMLLSQINCFYDDYKMVNRLLGAQFRWSTISTSILKPEAQSDSAVISTHFL